VDAGPKRYLVNAVTLPGQFPTHWHPVAFWEALGRVVATFGFLEEVLGKAIFAFTATRQHPQDEIEAAYEQWLPTLQRALSNPLGGLIDTYSKAVRDNDKATIANLPELVTDLREAADLRNVLCHGSWRAPDAQGRSVPLYVNKRDEIFTTPVDVAYLNQVRTHTAELACAIINTVTHMGWQFPGSSGPGSEVFRRPIDTPSSS
ncbi:hypothetical protein, partial [Caulobacter sp. HMWF009]